MKPIYQKTIADQVNVSQPYISQLVRTEKRPSWKMAKKLAEATNTTPILWLEGSPDEIRAALKNAPQN